MILIHDDKSILLQYIQVVVETITKCDKSLTVVQFGSSLDNYLYDGIDIDILLLSDTDYVGNKFMNKLEELRLGLLSGTHPLGFNMRTSRFESELSKTIAIYKPKGIYLRPKFTIGPIGTHLKKKGMINIFFHFKGPLLREQFSEFCKALPFHGVSILNNSRLLFGEFNKHTYLNDIKVTEEEFIFLLNGLKARVFLSDKKQIYKCMKKVVQNMIVFVNNNNIIYEEKIHKITFLIFSLNAGTFENNIAYLRTHFFNVVTQILSDLENKLFIVKYSTHLNKV